MRRRGKNSKILIYALIAILLLALVLVLWLQQKPRLSADTIIENNVINNANENTNNSPIPAAIAQENLNTNTPQLPATSYQIPILMFHYIRDYDNTADSIGVNLSVSPSKFSEELDAIEKAGYKTTNFSEIKNGNIPEKPIILTFDDGYLDFYTAAYPELKKRGMTAVSYVITNKIGADGYLSGEQIKELLNNNIEIGSHTKSHPDLSKAPETKVQAEIFESKQILENLIGAQVVSFCYPSGKYNDVVENFVKEAGYDYAVTTNGGLASFENFLELARYRINHDTNIEYYLK